MVDLLSCCRGSASSEIDALVAAHPLLLISGFWRSGTTWLQQMAVDATVSKSVFEPLDPRHMPVPVIEQLRTVMGNDTASQQLACFVPWFDDPSHIPDRLRTYLVDCGRAKSRGYRLRRARSSMVECLRRPVVIKFVRGHFSLGAFSAMYDVPVLHISRDPRAVVASLVRGNWWAGWLDSLSLRSLLIDPQDDRGSNLSRWYALIDKYEQGSSIHRLVVYWYILEEHAREFTAKSQRAHLIEYERLSSDPKLLLDACDAVGVPTADASVHHNRNSPTTGRKSKNVTTATRRERWRSELSPGEQKAIECVLDDCRSTANWVL